MRTASASRNGCAMVAATTSQKPVMNLAVAMRVVLKASRRVAGMRAAACVVTAIASVCWHGTDVSANSSSTGELSLGYCHQSAVRV